MSHETVVLLVKYLAGCQSYRDVIGNACSKHGGEEKYMLGFGGKVRRNEITRKT
jgi:hypothetical protein